MSFGASMVAGPRLLALTIVATGLVSLCGAGSGSADLSASDQFSWLEDVEGPRALAWVQAQNARTLKELTDDARYASNYHAALEALQDKRRIYVGLSAADFLRDGWVYNLWQDEVHPRGVWRRTELSSFRTPSPKWHTLLDLDDLGRHEGRAWGIYGEPICLPRSARCMLALADGGKDARVWREFDIERGQFVQNGFVLPEAISSVEWKDENTLLVVTNRDTSALTTSGFGTALKTWIRGKAFSEAEEVLRVSPDGWGVGLSVYTDGTTQQRWVMAWSPLSRNDTLFWIQTATGQFVRMSLPPSAQPPVLHQGELVFSITADWHVGGRTWPKSSIVSIPIAQATLENPPVKLLTTVGARESVWDISSSRAGVLVVSYAHVRGTLSSFTLERSQWRRHRVPLPDYGTVRRVMVDPGSETAFFSCESFLLPKTLYEVAVSKREVTPIKVEPSQFDAARYVSEQLEAVSSDGTKVPYFLVRPRNFVPNGTAPTLLEAYGASGLPRFPTYSPSLGRLWLDRGGVYVLANIRGGGEFGPEWFTQTLKSNRQRVYDDFYAVAKDLIRREITTSRHLGIEGLSAGGLLMGVAVTQHPELFNAAAIKVGVLDLLRYHKLSIGAAFIGEWGSPDVPAERSFLEQTSPYHNLHERADFPMPFILTSTKDDRVHPGHSRKFAARIEALGMPFLFYESPEGGHFLASTPPERAMIDALVFTYLARRLM